MLTSVDISAAQYVDVFVQTVISSQSVHQLQKPTEDDERQLEPDDSQPVEEEGRHDASDITQGGADGHAQVPTPREQESISMICTFTSYKYLPGQLASMTPQMKL